ncbi:S41 family peptidase [Neolewinella antarctica]|uniref:Tail specific protease domain-containing protein n=1 Tax=Neolewinella antarctica TaxID=442734 RepID=A0ABX0X865_9BACT|nr:S41 family peptidase [Neolewinella antarctica]NJC25342.1 hypothetical protein [Neolewinella antarctica]
MRLLLFSLTCLLFSSCSSFFLKNGLKEYEPTITSQASYRAANQYQRDLLYLDALCVNTFPLIEEVFPAARRQKVVDSLLVVLADPAMTEFEFAVTTRYYLGNFENQHTWMRGGTAYGLFPFILHPYGGRYYLANLQANFPLDLIGSEVTSLAGLSMAQVEKRVFPYFSAENATSRRRQFGSYVCRPSILAFMGLIAEGDSLEIGFADGRSVTLPAVNSDEDINFRDIEYPKPVITEYRDHNYDLTLHPEQDLGYLQFNKCYDLVDARATIPDYVRPFVVPLARVYLNRMARKEKEFKNAPGGFEIDYSRPVFRDYLETSMAELTASGAKNLVIDLRNNGGGSLLLCLQLLYHLTDRDDLKGFDEFLYLSEAFRQTDKKEYRRFVKNYAEVNGAPPEMNKLYSRETTRKDQDLFSEMKDVDSPYFIPSDRTVFDGKVMVLVGPGTGSAAALFTTLLQDNEIATVIGTTVGNNPTGATGLRPYSLPESGFTGSVASEYFVRPAPEKGRFFEPDFWMENSLEDLSAGRDAVFEKALELLHAAEVD